MKLIVDSGSTKTDWALLNRKDGTCIRFTSAGYNPNYITQEYMINDINSALPPELNINKVNEIYFYGAGVTELQFGFIRETLLRVFSCAEHIFVSMDLLGAARALLGHEAGFAVILGTGTNSCLYDGESVIRNIDSLGFILGDEGSGAYIGKQLICDYIRGNMPGKTHALVKEYIRLSGDELIDEIYTKPFPNRFCARYCKFVGENIYKDEYFYCLVKEAFISLFRNIITRYPDYEKYKLNCVGSVAWHFKYLLAEVAMEYQMEMGKVLCYPVEGLIDFHSRE
jgi:N-acetylglucosamine kinase-like BadF-type ATPase